MYFFKQKDATTFLLESCDVCYLLKYEAIVALMLIKVKCCAGPLYRGRFLGSKCGLVFVWCQVASSLVGTVGMVFLKPLVNDLLLATQIDYPIGTFSLEAAVGAALI